MGDYRRAGSMRNNLWPNNDRLWLLDMFFIFLDMPGQNISLKSLINEVIN